MRALRTSTAALFLLGACSVINSYDEVDETPPASGGSTGTGSSTGGTTGEGGGDPTTGGTSGGGKGGSTGASGGEGGEGTGGTGEGVLTFQDFYEQYIPALCERINYCGNKFGIGQLLLFTCHPTVGQEIMAQLGASDALAESFDPVEAQECLDAIRLKDCSVFNTFGERECNFVFTPTVPDGGTCEGEQDCLDGICVFSEVACGGTCESFPQQGDPCPDGDCVTGQFCNAMSECQPLGGTGDPCTGSDECEPTSWCNPDSGECEVLPNLNERCEVDLGGDPCRGSLVCAEPADGEPTICMVGGEEDDDCDFNHPCKPGLRCSDLTDTCIVAAPPGGECEADENCVPLFICIADVCEPLPVIGEPCDNLMTCVESTCVDGECTADPVGTACSSTGIFDTCLGYCDLDANMCANRKLEGVECEDDYECFESVCRGPEGMKECIACP